MSQEPDQPLRIDFSNDESSTTPPMKPWKKWLLRTLGAVILSFVVYFLQGWWRENDTRHRLDEIRSQLDALDPGWRLDEIQRDRLLRFPPDDQNITRLAMRIREDTPKEFDEFLVRADDPSPWLPVPDVNRLPKDDVLADARRIRTVCADVIARAFKLGELTDGGVIPPRTPNPIAMSLEHTQRLRNAASLLSLNSAVLAADNDGNAAIAHNRAILNLVRGVNDEPTLISMLVRLAISLIAIQATERTLGYTEPKTGLAELQAELLREAEQPVLAIGFRGERAWIDATMDYLREDPTAINRLGGPVNPLSFLGLFAFRSQIFSAQTTLLQVESRFLEIARGPSHEWLKAMKAVEFPGMENPFVRLLLPASEKATESTLRTLAKVRTMATAIECERFRQANGRWPRELAEIPKTILADLPRDPYVDAPLCYRVLKDGIVVYAVGQDLQNDGGTLSNSQPKPGEDVGVRLWSPEFRRLPNVAVP